jgi:trehalose-phosphatase
MPTRLVKIASHKSENRTRTSPEQEKALNMKVLRPGLNLDGFFQRINYRGKKALLLDYDGTLAPFRIRRDKAYPYPGVGNILETILQDDDTRLVIISGRAISDLLPLLGLDPTPEIWGSHGWERLTPGGSIETATMDPLASRCLESQQVEAEGAGLGDKVEAKPGCLALHWRGLEEAEIRELRRRFLPRWSDACRRFPLSLMEFDGGIELRMSGRNKAFVVDSIRSEMGDNTIMAFLGDDSTDEEAFTELGENDLGVLVRERYRPTTADLWIKPPEELIDFLKTWSERCRRTMDNQREPAHNHSSATKGDKK